MPTGVQRKDYARNARKNYRKQSGCTWYGDPGYGGPHQPDYCSDLCVTKDHEGIDDRPPVVPVGGHVRSMSEEAKSHAIQRMNDSYSTWAEGS